MAKKTEEKIQFFIKVWKNKISQTFRNRPTEGLNEKDVFIFRTVWHIIIRTHYDFAQYTESIERQRSKWV